MRLFLDYTKNKSSLGRIRIDDERRMLIRRPKFADIDQLLELGARMHAESAYAFLPYDQDKVCQLIVSCIEDGETYYGLVAEEGDRLFGMIGGYITDYFFCDEKLACDMVLFVDQNRRGSLAAARLIKGFRDWAAARGARELCLGISTNVNVEAIGNFYERMGLKCVGGIYKQRLDEECA